MWVMFAELSDAGRRCFPCCPFLTTSTARSEGARIDLGIHASPPDLVIFHRLCDRPWSRRPRISTISNLALTGVRIPHPAAILKWVRVRDGNWRRDFTLLRVAILDPCNNERHGQEKQLA